MNKLTKMLIISLFFLVTVAFAGRITANIDFEVSDDVETANLGRDPNAVLKAEYEEHYEKTALSDLRHACNEILESDDVSVIVNAYKSIEPHIPTGLEPEL